MSRDAASLTAATDQDRAWRHARFLVACAVVVALVGAACSSSKLRGPSTPVSGVRLTASELRTLSNQTTPFQLAILKDGFVSMDEYQKAALALVQCARDGGIVFVNEPVPSALGHYAFAYRYDNPKQKAVFDACYTKFYRQIDMAWAGYRAPHQDEILQAARDDLGNCLRAAGADVPQHPNSDDFEQYKSSPTAAFARCAQSVQQTDNLPGFIG